MVVEAGGRQGVNAGTQPGWRYLAVPIYLRGFTAKHDADASTVSTLRYSEIQ